jgi:hypothetical protein
MEQKEKKRKAGLNLNQRVWNKEKQDKAAYRPMEVIQVLQIDKLA